MKKTLILIALLAATVSVKAQSKPRKVVIHKYESIRRDSTIYLPDTIACYFKELVISPDTIYEKLNKGFVVWQTWTSPNVYASSIGTYGLTSGTFTLTGNGYKEPEPIENRYQFNETKRGKFLYSNYKTVTNKVIYSIAK